MKFVVASYGTRGDIEPAVVVGRELARRGHNVCMAVPPDSVGFAESAGLSTFAYGLPTQTWLDVYRNFWTSFFRGFWKIRTLRGLWRDMWDLSDQCWTQMSATLTSLAEGADVLFTGQSYQEPVANIAEHHGIPLVTLHHVPIRPNGYWVPILPPRLSRWAMEMFDWLAWLLNKKVEDAQRRDLGLPKAKNHPARRIAELGALEIQAYDEASFPKLAAEWARWEGHRPFVGALTMELTTENDDEVAQWIASGPPPICFAFGSIPVKSPTDAVEMISTACAALGQRALICAGWTDFGDISHAAEVKVVGAVNYGNVFPACRAVVHNGGSGTTAASLRAGVPTLILSMDANQTIWGAQLKRLGVGTSRKFSATTRKTLVSDLRRILAPEMAVRARELGTRMTAPTESASRTADLMEKFAGSRRVA
ncbi:glycosyl transferase family 1 [Mycolicibacterium novocastrense]|uniref:glycosyltransferase n=1 Tax=Mycolicibacterium novocastrense TaxID=59813 RepID=UPI00074A05D8|nr:glycosyltransferase [Mycolicibacterium novocastrense]KUH75820.1 glycosyl transferase family 1 [Mycolicibacterium novocastrense]KUH79874.1 glycosyl transferase family 1 [Mycolicibacterium novocastrense]